MFLPIIHHSLLGFSKHVAKFVSDNGFDLFAKNDYRFMEGVYKLLASHFNYRPCVSINQFFSSGFAERKLLFCADVISLCREKHKELAKRSSSVKPKSVTFEPVPNYKVVHHDHDPEARAVVTPTSAVTPHGVPKQLHSQLQTYQPSHRPGPSASGLTGP